jgi:hypothetical protein
MIINRICMKLKTSVAVAYFLPGRAKDLSALLYIQARKSSPHDKVNVSREAGGCGRIGGYAVQLFLNCCY